VLRWEHDELERPVDAERAQGRLGRPGAAREAGRHAVRPGGPLAVPGRPAVPGSWSWTRAKAHRRAARSASSTEFKMLEACLRPLVPTVLQELNVA
jgi:hypothetical protein